MDLSILRLMFSYFENKSIGSILWQPITATAITKRNTVNKGILINKKKFCSHMKVCF